MRALVYTALRRVEVQDRPRPTPMEDQVLVRIAATGICGSDLHGFLGHHARRQPGLVLGHETVGVVEEGPEEWIGRRVAVNPLVTCGNCAGCREGRSNTCATWRLLGLDDVAGAFAEYVAVPVANVLEIPDHLPDRRAALTEPLANAVHILGLLPPREGQKGAILGGGTLGSLILAVARQWGLEIVCVSEPNPARANAIRALGADRVVDSNVEPLPEGLDFVVDAVGRQVTREAAVKAVRKGGTVLLLGLDEAATTLDFQDLVRREICLQGSFAYTPEDFSTALSLLAEGLIHLDDYTDVMPLSEGQRAFDRLAADPGDRLKILLTP